MITQTNETSQLPDEINFVFKELKMLQHLKKTNKTKALGFTCSYLFQLVLLLSKQDQNYPAKDTVYHFLYYPTYAWRKFLTMHSFITIQKTDELTSDKRVKVLFVDNLRMSGTGVKR